MPEFQLPERKQNSNKSMYGKVLNISGSKNYIGAAFLSSKAVLKTGAGYNALVSDKNVLHTVATMLPESVFMSYFKGLNSIDKFNVILIGCGLGQSLCSKIRFIQFINKLKNTDKMVIIDADGLNILSQTNIELPKNTIITPHPAEAGRLLGISTEDVLADLETASINLCMKYNCITVLKTHTTIVRNDKELYVNTHGNSALSKAGTGDVLAGIIAGLSAQGLLPFEAAKTGVYLHSIAGELASKNLTEYSVLASDVVNYIPKAIQTLLTENS